MFKRLSVLQKLKRLHVLILLTHDRFLVLRFFFSAENNFLVAYIIEKK
jgi:hypothetical protein